MKKLIIAGSRSFSDYRMVFDYLKKYIEMHGICEVVCGGALGADTLGRSAALALGCPVKDFPADWKNLDAPGAVIRQGRYGPYNAQAGFDRNTQMADYADEAVIFFNGRSSGSTNMLEKMLSRHKPVATFDQGRREID